MQKLFLQINENNKHMKNSFIKIPINNFNFEMIKKMHIVSFFKVIIATFYTLFLTSHYSIKSCNVNLTALNSMKMNEILQAYVHLMTIHEYHIN